MRRPRFLSYLGESFLRLLRLLSLRASVLASSPPLFHPAGASRRQSLPDIPALARNDREAH